MAARRALSWISPVVAVAVAASAAAIARGEAAPRQNLIVISSDDHRWDGFGAAGHPALRTPNLDRLAAEGIHFRQATVHVSQCLPVRGSLLTGLPAHAHGAYSHHHRAPGSSRPDSFSELPTVPSLLAAAGYRTVLIGKWHLDPDPWRVGFNRTGTWLPGGGGPYESPKLLRGESREPVTIPGFTQEIFADEAVAFLTGAEARAQPFMLWLAFTAPHAPFEPNPDRIRALYRGTPAAALRPPGFPAEIAANDWLHYSEAVSHLDEQVGRVLEALERGGHAESSVVVFFGDNGHMMGERGVGVEGAAGKVVPYEGSVRIPMIVRAPGRQRVAGASDLAVSTLDLPPTLLALAGVPVPSHWPGRDLAPALESRSAPGFEEAWSEWADDASRQFGALAHRLVRTPTHKLIVWKDAARPDELYDLIGDPHELTNLAGTRAAAAIEADLRARLARWLDRTADPAREWPQLAPATTVAPHASE